MTSIQVHLYISGFVQGVGFRQFVKYHAQKLGVTGWIRNLSDERVEAVLQGDKEKLNTLVNICRKGPPIAEVHELSLLEEEVKEKFHEFLILK